MDEMDLIDGFEMDGFEESALLVESVLYFPTSPPAFSSLPVSAPMR